MTTGYPYTTAALSPFRHRMGRMVWALTLHRQSIQRLKVWQSLMEERLTAQEAEKPGFSEAHHEGGPGDPGTADRLGDSQLIRLVGQLKPILEWTMARIRRNRMVTAISSSLEVHAAAALPQFQL